MVNLENEFFKFIYKRQLIWYKRFVLKNNSPWTEDEVLRKYKIINVYRELDKCTIYIINKLKDIESREKILINLIFYRFFNQFNLYDKLKIEPFERIDAKLKNQLIVEFNNILSKNLPIFNNAYLISSGKKGQKKHISILDILEKINLEKLIKEIDNCKTPRESLNIIQKVPMIGPFLACEIWTDLTYFNFFKQKWNDNDFVNIGPGAKWGLEIMYDSKLSKKEQEEKLNHLHNIQENYLKEINKELSEKRPWEEIAFKDAFSNYPFLSITNIEGSLCEFRKYWNISHGKGRRKYFNLSSEVSLMKRRY